MLETIISYIVSFLCLSFLVFNLVKGIVRGVRNARGYKQWKLTEKQKGNLILAKTMKSWRRKCMIYGIEKLREVDRSMLFLSLINISLLLPHYKNGQETN